MNRHRSSRFLLPMLLASSLCAPAPGAGQQAPAAGPPGSPMEALVERRLLAEGETLLAAGSAGARKLEDARDEILCAAVEKRLVTARVEVSDAEVEAFYEVHRAEFSGGERIVLRHIFRRLSVRAPESERARARDELAAIRREILAGADFAALARTRSDSQSARFDGRIAPQLRGQLEPAIEAVVWRLAVGELSGVVETPIGFHIFRLEQLLPPQNIDPATARAVSRRKLTLAAATAGRERLFAELVRESGALWAPERLEPPTSSAAVLFSLGGDSATGAGLEVAQGELPFVEQHTRSLADLLRARATRALYLWKAAREQLAGAADVAPRLAEAGRVARLDAAIAVRVARRSAALTDADLRTIFAAQTERFAAPPRSRVRVLVRAFTPGHSPHYFFEELAALGGEIRAGHRDFASAARELSNDRSAGAGGDLGWIDLRDLGWWAGTRTYERVRNLAVGEVSVPLLVEVYDAAQLTDHARGYMLVRVEASEPRRLRSFAEARDDVATAWIAMHQVEVQREIEAEVRRATELPSGS